MKVEHLITKMNDALGWELRAINMYAHYAANVKGIHRLQLVPLFKQEVSESMMHADTVRNAIVKLGGICATERNSEEIIHTTNYKEMMKESLHTEMTAAKVYGELLKLLETGNDKELFDAIEQIYLSEVRSVEEMRLLLE
ncbi:MAG: ferritin-like domain-containing protein [Candidatus Poseidoniaceae archaeon]|jgi:bacterioferritin (cytochrome b1)|nr:ferritin-like domain-containing protein [Candidatus Poseidoniaceae archaeon]